MSPMVTPPAEKQCRRLYPPLASWGLGREAWAALLRVRTKAECPEGNLRELTRDNKPDCEIATKRKALT